MERDFTIFPGDSLVWRFVSRMRLVACGSMFAHGFFAMEIQYSQLKINHLSDMPSTKADGVVPSTKAVGGGISVVCLTRTSRYRSKRRSWLVPLLPTTATSELTYAGCHLTRLASDLGRARQKYICRIPF